MIRFKLDIEPFSINAMYYSNYRSKTAAARDWTAQVIHLLSHKSVLDKLDSMRSAFDPNTHSYKVTMIAYYPYDKFYTKKGHISSHTMDLSNWEKPLIDIIFLPKYYNMSYPDGVKNLNIDDKHITRLLSDKRPSRSETPYIDVKISKLAHRR